MNIMASRHINDTRLVISTETEAFFKRFSGRYETTFSCLRVIRVRGKLPSSLLPPKVGTVTVVGFEELLNQITIVSPV